MITLQILRSQKGVSQQKIASYLGISRQAYSLYETGQRKPNYEMLLKLSEYFGCTVDELLRPENEKARTTSGAGSLDIQNIKNIIPLPQIKRIPLLGNIACGEPILAIESSGESVTVPEVLHADFALRCKGDSMVNARILDGDVVYIQRQDDVDNGEIAAVIIDDEATLKRVYKDTEHGILTLMPENPAFPPLVYQGERLNDIRIIGKVVGFFSSQIK